MKKDCPTTISPKERIALGLDGWRMLRLYKSRRFLKLWSMMMLFPIGVCILRFSVRAPTSLMAFLPVLTVSGGGALALVSSLMTGEVITNRGLYLKSSEPIRFWATMLVCLVCYVAPVLLVWPFRDVEAQKDEEVTQ